MNHFDIPRLNPFWFVKSQPTPGIHLDDSHTCERIRSFMKRAYYKQKWQKADTTKLQIESSIAPDDLKLYNSAGTVQKSWTWTEVFAAVNYKIYETTFDVSDVPDGVYWLFAKATFGPLDWPAIAEPIHIKETWPNTLLITYKNSFNRDGIAWTTGIEMKFRIDACIMEDEADAEVVSYTNQSHDQEILDGEAFMKYKLFIGDAAGVSPYMLHILNLITIQNYTSYDCKRYVRFNNAKIEYQRQKNYGLVGGSLELTDADNTNTLHFSDSTPLAPGIVVAYNLQTAFFGPGSLVPVTDVEEQE